MFPHYGETEKVTLLYKIHYIHIYEFILIFSYIPLQITNENSIKTVAKCEEMININESNLYI